MLENKKRVFKSVWKSKTDGYFCGIKEYDSHATKKQEIRCTKELKKSASNIQ